MASYCPKCGYKLSLIDIKPECPVCGVNLVYYGMEETLKKEADMAEFEHACSQPGMDRLKAATIGSPLAIVRLVLGLFPLLATLLPMGTVAVNLPYYAETVGVNMISIVTKVFMALDVDHLFAMIDSQTVGTAYIFYIAALLSLVLAVLACIVNLVNLTMSCGKKGIQRNIATASIGLVFTIVAAVMMSLWVSGMNAAYPDVFVGSVAPWGALGMCVAYVAQIVVNIVYKKKDIKVKYKDLSEFLLPYDERQKLKEEKAKAEAKA
ncbi:MAG: hypothetical protein IKV76_11040 [Clostridia bacterium]|nr:hypothetical protein [Clostridia bacterium]